MVASESMLVFRVGTLWLAIPSREVVQLHAPVPVTPVPLAPSHVPGVVSLRGEVVPLLSLDEYFTGIATEPGQEATFVRIAVVASVGMRVGILCHEVRGVLTPLGEMQPFSSVGDPRLEQAAAGQIIMDDELLVVVDLGRLLEDAKVKG